MKEQVVQKIFPALGTANTITVYGKCDQSILEQVKQRVLELHRRFSIFDPDSEISRINQSAGIRPVPVSEETFSLLSLSLEYAAATNGAFDVTAGAMSGLWRNAIRAAAMPTQTEVERCKARCGFENLRLDDTHRTAFLAKAGVGLDLGGIAKGYAADEARRMLQEYGVENAQINFGGTVVVLGRTQRVGIQNPFQKTGTAMAELPLCDKAVVTSGSYEQCFFHEGKRFHHIIDLRTGWPACSGLVSVTLIGDAAVELDALATAVCCLGLQEGLPLLQQRGIEAVFVTDDGSVQMTPGLRGQVSFCA